MAKYIVTHGIRISKDFIPETFGRLTTIGPKFLLPIGKGRRHLYCVFKCECGNYTVSRVPDIKSGKIKSCGCYSKEISAIQGKKNKTHGGYGSPEYGIYIGIKTRCYKENKASFENYGGRGITVCDRWLCPVNGFLNFLADMGPRPSPKHSIERKDVNGNYCPENCRWATQEEQARNKRNNVNLTHNGKTQCLADWAKEVGLCKSTIVARISLGWSVADALTTPARRKRKH